MISGIAVLANNSLEAPLFGHTQQYPTVIEWLGQRALQKGLQARLALHQGLRTPSIRSAMAFLVGGNKQGLNEATFYER